jgi:hypothetical protein
LDELDLEEDFEQPEQAHAEPVHAEPVHAEPVHAEPVHAAAESDSSTAAVEALLPDLESKLQGLGLDAEQLAGVLSLSKAVVEQVVWEVVPQLAETMIKEEIKRLTAD